MNQKPWLPNHSEYTGETTEALISLAEEFDEVSVVFAFESALWKKWERFGGESLSEREADILAIVALDREVTNGGFDQFFFNSPRMFAQIVELSLAKLQCPVTLAATRDALSLVGTTDPDRLEKMMVESERAEWEDSLSECDMRFYKSDEDLLQQLFKFICENRSGIDLSLVASKAPEN